MDKMESEGSLSLRISRTAGTTIAACPCVVCCSCCLLIWVLVGIVVVTGSVAFSDAATKDWDILDQYHAEWRDAIDLSQQEVDCREAPDPCPVVTERSMSDVGNLGFSLMYQSRSGNVFTPENLQTMCKVESVLWGAAAYPEVCPLRPGRAAAVRGNSSNGKFELSDCAAQSASVVALFYGLAGVDLQECSLLPAAAVNQISGNMYNDLMSVETFQRSGFFIGNDVFKRSNWTGGLTARTRSMLALGYPLLGADVTDEKGLGDPAVAKEYGDQFYAAFEKDWLAFFGYELGGMRSAYWSTFIKDDLELIFFGNAFFSIETTRTIDLDMTFAIFSIVFVWGYLTYHTGSFFVGSISLWHIVMTIPMSVFFYKFWFQITYYRQLHGLLIFIILGVGADDVFVFSDAWRQAKSVIQAELEARSDVAADTWDDQTILAKQIAFAYRQTMVSVMNTSFTTAVAFLSTAASPIMPIKSMGVYAFILILANYILVITLTPAVYAVRECYLPECPCSCGRRASSKVVPERDVSDAPAVRPSVSDAQAKSAPKFMGRAIIPFFKLPFVAVATFTICIVWAIMNLVFATRLEPPVEDFTFFHKDHMVERAKAFTREQYAASASSGYNTLTISFGVKTVNRDVEPYVDTWKPHEWYGVPVYDTAFDLSRSDAQEFLRTFCQNLRAEACAEEGCKPVGKLVQQSSEAVSCFIEDFDAWNNGVKFEGQEFLDKLKLFRKSMSSTSGMDSGGSWAQSIGLVDGDLKFVQVRAKMSLRAFTGTSIKEPVLNRLEEFLDREKSRAPSGMGHIIHSVPWDWIWLQTSKGLISGLFTGFAICFPVAFLVLLFATRNIIIAFMAILMVAFIVGNVLGYCYLAGWALGAGECVAGIIVIGLSVDYVIHLGHMYLEASHLGLETRKERWEFSLNTMGSTVIAGATTTFFAGLVMQFCQIVFFNQMSTLMIFTVVYSLLYAICCFMAMLYVIGPERDQGSLSCISKKLQ